MRYHLSKSKLDFNCPKCECLHKEQDYFEKFRISKKPTFYMNCKGCKTRLGIEQDIQSNTVVWLKEDEIKL